MDFKIIQDIQNIIYILQFQKKSNIRLNLNNYKI